MKCLRNEYRSRMQFSMRIWMTDGKLVRPVSIKDTAITPFYCYFRRRRTTPSLKHVRLIRVIRNRISSTNSGWNFAGFWNVGQTTKAVVDAFEKMAWLTTLLAGKKDIRTWYLRHLWTLEQFKGDSRFTKFSRTYRD